MPASTVIPPDPTRLVPLDLFEGPALRVDLAYARADNRLFGERIYRPGARLWLHEDLATIVILAAAQLKRRHSLRLVACDGLRTVEAQEQMLHTRAVRENPGWLEEPRLLSPPGAGGHPRAMAVDLDLEGPDGRLLDMGTPFDYLARDPAPAHNPAHRLHPGLSAGARRNRDILETCMTEAAGFLNLPLVALAEEWWDFRMPPETLRLYAPLRDADLPPQMRMTGTTVSGGLPDFPDSHFVVLRARVLAVLEAF